MYFFIDFINFATVFTRSTRRNAVEIQRGRKCRKNVPYYD